ncbi:P-type ATPase [Fusarium mundagurra]|uniref:P-type ATPase n=1 Tax=Fusarium mundagurra TaxID=1567541 RepID=A0A8H5Y8T1_9HYPO|nr:P-type ATPase [Fusarium mundagurra]
MSPVNKSNPLQDEHITVGNEEVTVQHLSLSGITCESCCTAVETALLKVPGIVKVTTSLLLSSTTIVYERKVLGLDRIRSIIHDAGYQTSLEQNQTELVEVMSRKKELQQLHEAFRGSAVLSAVVWTWSSIMFPPTVLKERGLESWGYLVFSLLPAWFAQVWYARSIHQGAWRKADKAGMDMLVSLSILLGLEYSLAQYLLRTRSLDGQSQIPDDSIHISNALLVTVVLGGRYLNQALRAKATSQISTLHKLQSVIPNILILPCRTPTPTFLLQTNDRILIPADSVIPCDCYVTSGSSLIDQSLLTGETAHLLKNPGDLIMSGTYNLSSDLEAVVTHPPEKSSLARLTEAVRASSSSSTEIPTEIFHHITAFTAYFAKFVIALAIMSFLIVWSSSIISGNDWKFAWSQATKRAMLILSVACPCSLGLATPAATMAGLNAALKQGVLVKGGLGTMAKLATLTHMAFDKTGTLTRAGLGVSNACFLGGFSKQDIYAVLCAVQKDQHTRHIVGRAVFRWAYKLLDSSGKSRLEAIITKDLLLVDGKGVTGKVSLRGDGEWTDVIVGSARFLEESKVSIETERLVTTETASRILHVGLNGKWAGFMTLEDIIRTDARGTVERLREMGLNISMITGDNRVEATRVSSVLGIPQQSVISNALPWDKESAIRRIQNSGGVVAMIGDGANDLAAQSAADVSMAVCAGGDASGLGAALALASAADVTLLSGTDLNAFCELVRIAKRTVRQARINLIWALAYNSAGLLATIGVLEPLGIRLEVSVTGMMMAMSSITAYLMEAHTRLNHSSSPPGLSVQVDEEFFLGDDEEDILNPPIQSLLQLGHSDTAATILSQRHSEMPEIADRMASLILMYRLLKASVIFSFGLVASVEIWSF